MKKLFALLLVLLLLTGCGSLPDVDPTAASTTVTTEALDPTEASTEATTEPVDSTEDTTEVTTEPVTTEPEDTETEFQGLQVHYIDVNQADGIILECDGAYAVIDAGYPESGPVMVEYLRDLGAESLDLVVATHPHGDHIGGLPDVLNAFPTDTLWVSQTPYSNDYVNNFRNAATNNGVELEYPRPGAEFQLGNATIEVIGPLGLQYEDANNLSLVLMVEHGDNRFLFTGDMEELAEHELVDAGVDLKADVLKVGHHGSYSSSSYRFLREVLPTYSVISCGAANDYGHPHEVTMSRLQDAETIIYRTDRMYTITARSDGKEIEFICENAFAKPWTPGT